MSQQVTQEQQISILIAGIGNIFLGDDGFGVEVAQRLLRRVDSAYPDSVRVVDFGIRGIELAYTLLDDYDLIILVDTLPCLGSPGTLHLLEIGATQKEQTQNLEEAQYVYLDGHSMDPVKVLSFAHTLGARPKRTLLVGCEAATSLNEESELDFQPGLSHEVAQAIDGAIQMIDCLVQEISC
ncbi:hydrogenase maturation protease [Ktedonospora formicarum]|uniref:Peptidase M52 n=1 Tax=Ktedonospora formicarum TaxID=2778364 RepID=A0A8J3HXZ4_9CHLR|nr:hydrogenase maturation protease [Ktedonospora formicarum]GHO42588.1 peptidase M52 [Ktedonospora formicarum]